MFRPGSVALIGAALTLGAAGALALDKPIGKTPEWPAEETADQRPVIDRSPGKLPLDTPAAYRPAAPDIASQDPQGIRAANAPASVNAIAPAVRFIQSQRGLSGRGLPATFYVPPGTVFDDSLRQLLVSEGVGTYDTALAVIVLVEGHRLKEAAELLSVYASGHYAEGAMSPLELRAIPSRYNGGAFAPHDESTHYFFDFTNLYGDWLRWGERWRFWTAHTGPNAWLANAALRLAMELPGQGSADTKTFIALAENIGQAMMRLQDAEAQGAVRYGPKGMWHESGTSDAYFELNTENNVSAYAAFRLMARVTSRAKYDAAADRILEWLARADGVMDPATGTLRKGMEWHRGRWVAQPEHPTDAGGTWTISSLGAETIDRLWGPKAAYRMWRSIRAGAGRTADFSPAGENHPLAGLDFLDTFPPEELLISPEWSAGGLFALKELIGYYGAPARAGILTSAERQGLADDLASMQRFIAKNPNPYAIGPGLGGKRQGATGFHWSAPPANVHAMASVYFALAADGGQDPLAVWRNKTP